MQHAYVSDPEGRMYCQDCGKDGAEGGNCEAPAALVRSLCDELLSRLRVPGSQLEVSQQRFLDRVYVLGMSTDFLDTGFDVRFTVRHVARALNVPLPTTLDHINRHPIPLGKTLMREEDYAFIAGEDEP